MEKISIVVPVYNAEETIVHTLESIKAQSYTCFEVIIIDDGSTDNSLYVCKKFIGYDERFIIVAQSNAGVSVARNKGISKSNGNYIMFVDSDDILPQDSLLHLVNALKKDNAELVCGSFRYIKNHNRTEDFLYDDAKFFENEYVDSIFTIANKVSHAPWAKLFSLKVIKEHGISFPRGIPCGEDGVFLYNFMSHISRLITINHIVYYYNYTSNTSSAKKYYKEYNSFLRMLADAKITVCRSVCQSSYQSEIETEFLNRCINYYIINEREEDVLQTKLGQSITMFPKAIIERRLQCEVNSQNWKKFCFLWKKRNFTFFIREIAKRIVYGVREVNDN